MQRQAQPYGKTLHNGVFGAVKANRYMPLCKSSKIDGEEAREAMFVTKVKMLGLQASLAFQANTAV